MKPVIPPGAAVGVLGGGQLGRMFALTARRLGYRVHVLSPERDSPAGQVADVERCAAYDDLDAVRAFARGVSVVTFEFENVPAATAAAAAREVPVRPDGAVLHTTQQRWREKTFLTGAGLPVPEFARVGSLADLALALKRIGCPALLKSTSFGYDGKGQARIDSPHQAAAAWQAIGGHESLLETFVPFERELSVVAARGLDGELRTFPVLENTHARRILDVSLAPARVPRAIAREALDLTRIVTERLGVVGVVCVEFFMTADGRLLINEVAPRPHNSGHLTIDACATSQFEQQLRAVCGLPLGAVDLVRPAAMANLLGELWADGEPEWREVLAHHDVRLHLYGKHQPRPGRKMGHMTALADTGRHAADVVRAARAALIRRQAETCDPKA